MATRNTVKGVGGKRTNEQYTWVNSKCKKRSYVKLCIPLCICRLKLAWISSEISTKLLGMPTHLDRSSLTALDPISYEWSLVCPVSTAHLRHPSPTAFSQSLCPTPLAFPYPLPVTSRSWVQAFVWFRAKKDKGIVCLADHLRSVTVHVICDRVLPWYRARVTACQYANGDLTASEVADIPRKHSLYEYFLQSRDRS